MASEFQEISTNKLLEAAKHLITRDDIKFGEFYLNLMKYSGGSDSIGAKIQALYHLSNLYKRNKEENKMIKIGRKILKWKEMLDFKRYNQDILGIIIQILLNCVDVCAEKEKTIFAGWFLFLSKTISMENVVKDEQLNERIKNLFPKILKILNEEFNDIYFELKPKRENLIKISESLEKYFCNTNKKFEINESAYIVDSLWLKNMLDFIQKFNNTKEKADQLFIANNVCLLYYEQNEDDSQESKGNFCGPINNYELTKQKNFWVDPDKSYTNVYLRKDIENQKNFELINKEIYTKINFYFKNTFEIERFCYDNNGNVEIFLFEIQLLFLNEYIREKTKNHLIPKSIQLSHFDTIGELVSKIQRVFLNFAKENKFDDYDYEFKTYLLEFKKKEIIEMIISYSNLNKTFKFHGEDLSEVDQSTKIGDYFKDKKYIIVCEPISKNTIVKPFLRKISKSLNCSLCNFVIESPEKIVHCSHCSQAIYCSLNCKSQDHQHIDFHKKISSLYEATLNTEEIQQININAFLDGKSRHGLVGLKNSGNIDFLLAPVQVLSHCSVLTKFFLSNNYLDFSGKAKDPSSLCGSYAELINQLWVGSSETASPNNLRNTFFAMLKDLSSASNIDAFDIFIVLLDKMHSELNQIKQKPNDLYFYEEENGESDMQACARWWKTHTQMNKSIIIDLFQGQFKMKVKCSFCKKVSISFPPFLYAELPIPDKEEMSKIRFKVFPYDMNYKYVSVELFDVNKFTSIKDIKKRIKVYNVFKNSSIEALLFKDTELVQILDDDILIYDYIFTRYNFSDEEFTEWEISFIEVPEDSKNDLTKVYVTPITFEEEKGYFYTTKNILPLSYTRLFAMNQKLTLKDLYKEIFKYYRRSMDDQLKHDTEGNRDETYYTTFYQKINDDSFIENEYNKCINDKLFDVYFYHNLEKNDSWFFSGPPCDYCKSSKGTFCKVALPPSTPLKELTLMQRTKRPIFMLVDFSKFKDNFSPFYSQMQDLSDPRMSLSEEITIYDCFDIFRKEEKMTKEKDYICPRCSRKIEPFRQMEPFKAPNYLILNIKRFKKKFDDLMDMINNKKNETFVEYPLNNLDLTTYFLGESDSVVYDLCSIICHKGTIKQGHNYAIVKNKEEWYSIDDEEITKLETKDVVTRDAFVLMYKRRESDKKKIKEEDDVLNIDTSINSVANKNFGEMKNI